MRTLTTLKKTSLALFASAALALVATGCNKEQAADKPDSKTPEQKVKENANAVPTNPNSTPAPAAATTVDLTPTRPADAGVTVDRAPTTGPSATAHSEAIMNNIGPGAVGMSVPIDDDAGIVQEGKNTMPQ